MPREVDPKATRKAMRIVRKLKELAAREEIDPETGEVTPREGADYSQWENEFLGEVDARLEKYGSAFHNLQKGRAEDALSHLQTQKLKEIAAKARNKDKGGKPRKGLQTRKPLGARKKRGEQAD